MYVRVRANCDIQSIPLALNKSQQFATKISRQHTTGHCCPTCRTGQLLNLYWEKTPECVFYAAVERAVGELGGLTLVDYCATEDLFVADIEGSDEGDGERA